MAGAPALTGLPHRLIRVTSRCRTSCQFSGLCIDNHKQPESTRVEKPTLLCNYVELEIWYSGFQIIGHLVCSRRRVMSTLGHMKKRKPHELEPPPRTTYIVAGLMAVFLIGLVFAGGKYYLGYWPGDAPFLARFGSQPHVWASH
jgi:hypothetical protein